MQQFKNTYLTKFSGIRRMHGDIARIIQTEKQITTALGRRRLFFGRVQEDDVLRKAIAYPNQSSVGDILNLGMWKVWKHLPEVDLLAQLHDAILFEYDDDPEVERYIITRAIELMTIPVDVTDMRLRNPMTRTMTIPVAATVGWNWGKYHPKLNTDGLLPYNLQSTRVRSAPPSLNLIHRILS